MKAPRRRNKPRRAGGSGRPRRLKPVSLWRVFALAAVLLASIPPQAARAAGERAAGAPGAKSSAAPRKPAAKSADAQDASAAALLAGAEEALRAGVPEAALARIEELPPAARGAPEARLLEIEARARSAEPARAVQVPLHGLETSAAAPFWQGKALAALERWPEALLKFQRAADLGFGPEALLGAADSLRAIGAREAALDALNRLLAEAPPGEEAGGPLAGEALVRRAELFLALPDLPAAEEDIKRIEARPALAATAAVLRGKLCLLKGDFAGAAGHFKSALSPAEGAGRTSAPAVLGLAKALDAMGQREEARRMISGFIAANAAHPAMAELFAAFDALQPAEPGPVDPELLAWSRGPNSPRKIHAVFYVAKAEARAGKQDRAARRLRDFLEDFPDTPLASAALLELARIQLEDGANAEAVRAAEAARALGGTEETLAWVSFLEGQALFGLQRYEEAAKAFEAAAGAGPVIEEKALFNAAICAIRTGDYEAFLGRYAAFSSKFPESPRRRDLLVEQGLFQARNRDPGAEKTLGVFLRDFPGHPRTGEARLALAELRFQSGPERAPAALEMLGAARDFGLSDELSAQADLLELWIASSLPGVSPDEVVRLGKALLAKKPAGAKAHLIRMKLGAVFYGMEDFTNARDQFEQAAKDAPDPEAADQASLMAGMAAMRMMDTAALEAADAIFEEVAAGGGPRALEARRFQGEIRSMLGRHDEAVAAYDLILASNPPPRDQAEITLLKAQALTESGAAGDTARVVKALPLFDAAAAAASAYPALRNEALFLKGRALESLGQPDKALAAYFDVLRTPMGGALDPEYFWFYKAGFEAARLLEERQSYESAVEVYSQLADADGPGAKDAARRMEQLRLRHFLWGD